MLRRFHAMEHSDAAPFELEGFVASLWLRNRCSSSKVAFGSRGASALDTRIGGNRTARDVFVNDAAFHNENYAAHRGYIFKGIAI